MQRIAILGNAGSGKTYLASRLASIHSIPTIDLDDLFWQRPGDYTTKRPQHALRALVDLERSKAAWIVEGVYGELLESFLVSAQQLFWLDAPWEVCLERITHRQAARGRTADDDSFRALVRYAAAYWERNDGRSHAGHRRLFDAFAGEKHCFTSAAALNAFLERHVHG